MKHKIYTALIENGYSEKSANLILEDLIHLSSPLDKYLMEWIDNGNCKDYVSDGFSVLDFQEKRGMKYPAALLTMDWLIKEPERTKESLKRGLR